ncbi:MAG: hypothetical protein KKG00_02345 [Bacteroidetes bacterium]|nr:hypothetical protein [Bacteroidota bacterium]
MEFQELAKLWNSADEELGSRIEINRKLVKEVSMRKVRSHLTEVKWTAYFELAVNLLFVQFVGRYVVENLYEVKFLIPGLLLFAMTLFSLIFSSYQLTLYYGIRSGTSVVQTQTKLARLRYLELLDLNLLYIMIPLFYATGIIVAAKAVADYDMYRHASFLFYNTLASAVIAVVLIFILKKYPDKRLKEAQAFVDELKEAKKR